MSACLKQAPFQNQVFAKIPLKRVFRDSATPGTHFLRPSVFGCWIGEARANGSPANWSLEGPHQNIPFPILRGPLLSKRPKWTKTGVLQVGVGFFLCFPFQANTGCAGLVNGNTCVTLALWILSHTQVRSPSANASTPSSAQRFELHLPLRTGPLTTTSRTRGSSCLKRIHLTTFGFPCPFFSDPKR